MASQKAVSANVYHNGGGTILQAGNIASQTANTIPTAPITYNLTLSKGQQNLIQGPIVYTNTRKANTSGNFARMTAGKYVIMRTTTELAGVSNTVLLTGAGAFNRRPIAFYEYDSVVKIISTGGWYYQSGRPVSATFERYIMKSIDSSSSVDQAARPSLAVPGEFVYIETGKNATLDDYPART